MNKYQKTAQWLIALGCFLLLAGSLLHLTIAYPRVSEAVMRSNLDDVLKNALRSVFLLIGLTWIGLVVAALLATFAKTQASKRIALFCGLVLLLEVPVWVGVMGWFVGNEIFLLGSGLIVGGAMVWRDRWA